MDKFSIPRVSVPQSLGPTASPTFAGLLVNGNIASLVKIEAIDSDAVLVDADCKGTLILIGSAHTPVLPEVTSANIGMSLIAYSTGGNIIGVRPHSDNAIVLDGVAGGSGKRIFSDGTVGDYASMIADQVGQFTIIGHAGTWTLET